MRTRRPRSQRAACVRDVRRVRPTFLEQMGPCVIEKFYADKHISRIFINFYLNSISTIFFQIIFAKLFVKAFLIPWCLRRGSLSVHSAARPSDRVPFGAGPKIRQIAYFEPVEWRAVSFSLSNCNWNQDDWGSGVFHNIGGDTASDQVVQHAVVFGSHDYHVRFASDSTRLAKIWFQTTTRRYKIRRTDNSYSTREKTGIIQM